MGLLDSVKELQNMAKQAKNIASQFKNMLGEQSQTPTKTSCIPNSKEIASEQNQTISDASGRLVIQSEVQMETWLSSISTQTQSTTILKVIDAQIQVIKFVKAPSLLGMVLDNMIVVLYQTLREASSDKEKTELRETISLMIQNLIFFSDAQLHYAIDQNKQEAKQLLSTAGNMLAKSVTMVASLAAGPSATASVVIKNIFSSEEMQNGFFGRLINWIMDKRQIEKYKNEFNIALKNLFDTFDKYSTLIGPSIQIHGMLHRYEPQLIEKKYIETYSGLYSQFVNEINTLNDKGLDLNAEESLKNLETLIAPLNITLEKSDIFDADSLVKDGLLQMTGKLYLGSNFTNKISKIITGNNRNFKDATMAAFSHDFLLAINEQFDQYVASYAAQIESLKKEIDEISFIKFSAKKDLENQCTSATNEMNFCKEVISKLNYYITTAKKLEDEVLLYTNTLTTITAKYSLDIQSVSENPQVNNSNDSARQKFDKMWNMALSDSEISDKERNILWKYAEAAGIEEGEFELMIENKINMK